MMRRITARGVSQTALPWIRLLIAEIAINHVRRALRVIDGRKLTRERFEEFCDSVKDYLPENQMVELHEAFEEVWNGQQQK